MKSLLTSWGAYPHTPQTGHPCHWQTEVGPQWQQLIETHGQAVGEQKAPRLLIGSEMTTTIESTAGPRLDGLKLVFLACNRHGYGNLSALITLARRRAAKGAYTLQRHDLNVISPNGALPDCLVLWLPDETPSVADGRWLAERFAVHLRAIG